MSNQSHPSSHEADPDNDPVVWIKFIIMWGCVIAISLALPCAAPFVMVWAAHKGFQMSKKGS